MTDRDALRAIEPLAAKVARVHGDHDPKLIEVHQSLLGGAPARETMQRIRELTRDFVPPEWACASYRRLLDELRSLAEAF